MTSIARVEPITDLLAGAKTAAAVADEHAEQGDRQGQLSAPVVEALNREGLFGMWVPRSMRGGAELDPVSSLRVIESVSYGDPSAGWVLMAGALATGTGAAYLGDEAVAELFGGERLPLIAGQGTRPGTAVPQAGGFSLSGSWSFASGLKHATHIHTLAVIEGTGEPRIFVLPVGKATLIENWDVLGLRATGSIDYRTTDVFVPEAYTHFAVTESPKRGGALYTIGIAGFAVLCHSGWACGIGRRLLDELSKKVRSGIGRSGTLANSDAFHEQYARAEATCPSGTRPGGRGVGERQGVTRSGCEDRGSSAHAGAPGSSPHHLVLPRDRGIRLLLGWHHRAARRHDPAPVPRHARGNPAHHVGASRDPQRRSRAGRSG